jgi:hypothetical protein
MLLWGAAHEQPFPLAFRRFSWQWATVPMMACAAVLFIECMDIREGLFLPFGLIYLMLWLK